MHAKETVRTAVICKTATKKRTDASIDSSGDPLMSSAAEVIDVDNDDHEAAASAIAPAKRRRISEVEALQSWVAGENNEKGGDSSEAASRRMSGRLAEVQQQQEVRTYKNQLAEAEAVQSRLFKKLEKVEKRADDAEEQLAELKKGGGSSRKGKASGSTISAEKASAANAKLKQANAGLREQLKQQKQQMAALRKVASRCAA